MGSIKLLIINPGSTSTKIAIFEDEKEIFSKKIEHSTGELAKFAKVSDQYHYRKQLIYKFLAEKGIEIPSLSAIGARGGFIRPVPSGVFKVCAKMFQDLNEAKYGEHASNLGAMIAFGMSWEYRIPSFIVDPVVVDEMNDIARFSGLKEIQRKSIWHALNIMAVTRAVCKANGWDIKKESFVVAHLGGGISVAAIECGRCIDVSNGLEAGPYTPERAGSLPSLELVNLCFSGKYTHAEMKKLIVGKGGLVNYLGTSNLKDVEERILQGDDYAKQVFLGMAYQIAKEIGSYLVVLKGKAKRIIITGGAARSDLLVSKIKEYVSPLCEVLVSPGEDEMLALAQGCLRVLRGEEKALDYSDFLPKNEVKK